jgi:nifR3 family TIM-barrel protein
MQSTPLHIGTLPLASPLILAPMAGITSLPFRRIMKKCGAALVFTEMISANGLIRDGRKTMELLRSCAEEKPLGIQLFGDDPQVLAAAAQRVGDQADLLDINMGCPVKKVVRSGAGSALLRSPRRIGEILAATRRVFNGPLTIKIRSGWDQTCLNYLEVSRIAREEGVDAICLHPRSRSQSFSGAANWQQIAELKTRLDIPIIGSGDLFSAADVCRMFRETGCDAVMIARGGYGNPWIFQQAAALLQQQAETPITPEQRWTVIEQHLDWHLAEFGAHKACIEMRKHLSWYAKGMPAATQFRGQLQGLSSWPALLDAARNFFHPDPP